MTYSTGWTQEAAKIHGEALGARVYVSNIGDYESSTTNFWSKEKAYNTWLGIGSMTASTAYGTPIQNEEVFELTAGIWVNMNYIMLDRPLEIANNFTFSTYIHSSTTTTYTGMSMNVVDYNASTASVDETNSVWFMSAVTGYEVDNIKSGTSFVSAGSSYVGSGWSRVWMSLIQPQTGRADREYRFYTYSDRSPAPISPPNKLVISSFQIDAGTTTPRSYRYRKGVVIHPSDKILLSDYTTTTNINPITRSRERYFGVVQGQSFPLSIANTNIEAMNKYLPDSKVAIQFGFPSYNVWETVFQGKINDVTRSQDMSLTLNVSEAVMDIISMELQRDINFDVVPYTSSITPVSIGSGTTKYTGTTGFTYATALSGSVIDQEFNIIFDTSTAYRIYDEAGVALNDTTGTMTISGTTYLTTLNANFSPASEDVGTTGGTPNVYTIYSGGWGTGGIRVSGDTFKMTSSRARTQDELCPIGIVKGLISDTCGLYVYDVVSETYFDSPFSNEAEWDDFIAQTSGETTGLRGLWKAGTKVTKMIQECLMLEHSSIFPTEDGRIGISSIFDRTTGSTLLNGNAGSNVNIINSSITDTMEDYANNVVVKYMDISTGDDVSTSVFSTARERELRPMVIETDWQVPASMAYACASRALFRYNQPKRVFTMDTTLATGDLDINEAVTIDDSFMGVTLEKVTVTQRGLDLNNQAIKLVAWNDPLQSLTIARVDYTIVGSTEESLW